MGRVCGGGNARVGRHCGHPDRTGEDARRSCATRLVDDVALDNGQHLLIGAYHHTLELIEAVHGAERIASLFRRLPLTLRPFGREIRTPSRSRHGARRSAGISRARMLTARGLDCRRADRAPGGLSACSRAPAFAAAADRRSPNASPGRRARVRRDLGAALRCGTQHAPGGRIGANLRQRAARDVCRRRDQQRPPRPRRRPLRLLSGGRRTPFIERGGGVRQGATVRAIVREGIGIDWRSAPAPKPSTQRSSRWVRINSPRRWARRMPRTPHGERRSPRSPRSPTNRSRRSTSPMRHASRSRRRCCASTTRRGHWAFDRSDAILARDDATGLVAVVISAGGPHDRSITRRSRKPPKRRCGDLPRTAAGHLVAGDRRETRDVRVHAGAVPSRARQGYRRSLSRRRLHRRRLPGDARGGDATAVSRRLAR